MSAAGDVVAISYDDQGYQTLLVATVSCSQDDHEEYLIQFSSQFRSCRVLLGKHDVKRASPESVRDVYSEAAHDHEQT